MVDELLFGKEQETAALIRQGPFSKPSNVGRCATRRRPTMASLGLTRCSVDVDRFWSPIIAVPARNEAQRLPALIHALGKQTWLAGHGRRLPVVIVLNNCTDDSAAIAASAAAEHPNLLVDLSAIDFSAEDAHVGSARRLAAEKAWAARLHPTDSVLMMTDADAVPEPTWVEANIRAIDGGADIVGGLIVGDETEEALLGPRFLRRAARQLRYARLIDRLAALIDPLPYDPWPRHCDHTGASIAVRADVYAAVGGLPALAFREDLAFVSRVRAAGYRMRHSLEVRVRVSARLEGRAPGGMADCLKNWVEAEARGWPHLVEKPQAVAARLRMRRLLRKLDSSAPEFERSGRFLDRASTSSHVFGSRPISIPALIETLAPEEPDAMASMPIELALPAITQMIADAHEARIG
jgi:hypothetical protein